MSCEVRDMQSHGSYYRGSVDIRLGILSTAAEVFVLLLQEQPSKGQGAGVTQGRMGERKSPTGIHRSLAPPQKMEL